MMANKVKVREFNGNYKITIPIQIIKDVGIKKGDCLLWSIQYGGDIIIRKYL